MAYKTGIFRGKNPDRAKQRTSKFSQFFNDLGLEPQSDPFKHDPEPSAQLSHVQSLIEKATSLHGDDLSALKMMSSEVGSLQSGVGAFATSKLDRPDIESCTTTAMTLKFFTQDIG